MIERRSFSPRERERFIDDVVGYMTLTEKAGQLVMVSPDAPDASLSETDLLDALRQGRVGAVHGLWDRRQVDRLQRVAVEETRLGIPLLFAGDTGNGRRVVMPAPIAAAASWDAAAVECAERAVAAEARAEGICWAFAPTLRLAHGAGDPDLSDSLGESALLAERLAVALVEGLQQRTGGGTMAMLACADLRGDDSEDTFHLRSRHDPAALLAVLLAALREGGAGSAVRGIGAFLAGSGGEAQSRTLDLLRGGWGFGGILLSEWWDMADLAGAGAVTGTATGLSVDALVAAVRSGAVAETRLDEAVRRVIGAKYDLGLFQLASSHPQAAGEAAASPTESREAARDLAARSAILLRNQPALLPLTVDSGELLVVGAAARDRELPLAGRPGQALSLTDGLDAVGLYHKFAPGLALRHDRGPAGDLIDADRMAIGMAAEAARRSGTVVLALGACTDDGLPGEAERQLIGALLSANANLAVVSLGARPPLLHDGQRTPPCHLHAGQLGSMSGLAIAELLTGEAQPAGRLPFALPAGWTAPARPFGYGLAYTDFVYANFALELGADRVIASVELRNVGTRAGVETVQLYIRDRAGRGHAAEPVLKDFARVALEAGQAETVLFELGAAQLGRYDREGRLIVEQGRYEVLLGPHADTPHSAAIDVPEAVIEAMIAGDGRIQTGQRRKRA